ncbi:Hsp20 family protein [Bacteriovorax sp. Seq25_V]|uniref:Hsp20 family protein n=1 Tax=Bacteriovorax sp. Seq25_V TaxID=1201288 RepID=UPI0012F7299D|nr:Hsp20 family protein [Bacteriovorax sp. Seq25_V]
MNKNKRYIYFFAVICLILIAVNVSDTITKRVPVAKERSDLKSQEGLFTNSLTNIVSNKIDMLPVVNIDESYSETHYIVEIKSPNMNRDSIAINISNGVILVSGELVQKTERSSFTSSFSRSFSIRDGFDSTNPELETIDEGVVLKFKRKVQ